MSNKDPGWDFLSKPDGGFIDGDEGDSYRYSDGSGYYHGTDGSEGYIYSDGSGYYHGADGSDGYIYSDGSGYYHGADGSDGYRYADGSGYFHGTDGSDGYRYSDGSGYYNRGDGSSSQFEEYDDDDDDDDDDYDDDDDDHDDDDDDDDDDYDDDYDDDDDDDDDDNYGSYTFTGNHSSYSSYTSSTANLNINHTGRAATNNDSDNKTLLKILLGVAIFLILDFAFLGWMAYKHTDTPISSKDCIGKNYETIARQFKDAGFKHIETVPVEDLKDGWIFKDTNKVDTVQSISIKGDTKFKKGKEYDKADQVTIYYHIYPH